MPGVVVVELVYTPWHAHDRGVAFAVAGFAAYGPPADRFALGKPIHADRLAELYVSDGQPGTVDVYRYRGRTGWGSSHWFPVPAWALAAFEAGEDWRPLVDWLLEGYPDRLGWLAEIVAQVGENNES